MRHAATHRFLVIADGQFGLMTSKTANCCIRYMPERIVGVLDRAQAGKTVQEVLGFGGVLPVVGDFERGLGLGPTAVLIRSTRSEEHTSELQSPCNLVLRPPPGK